MNRKIALELFILSAISLFIELLIIRWMSADIRLFTVFHTFPLITCFIGLGVGFAMGKDDVYKHLPQAVLMFALILKVCDFLGIGSWGFPSLGVFQWENLVGMVHSSYAYVILLMLIVILLLAFPFGICVCIGARLGVLFSGLKPLQAYSLNVAGAIAGSILFPVLSVLGAAPWQLLLVPTAYIAVDQFLKYKKIALSYLLIFALVPLAYSFVPGQHAKPLFPQLELSKYQRGEAKTLWSPYQRIDLSVYANPEDNKVNPGQFIGLELSVNRAFYQYFFNTGNDTVIANDDLIQAIRMDYHLPFTFNTAKDVLIVGAGMGQNVSAALSAGANKVDAVEIDPVILDVGHKYNQDYSSPKVNSICDDARHFFSQTKNRYDVINFSTLDSHAVAGLGSSVRVDSYVYSKESIATALSLLKDDGIIQISFVTFAPWMEQRLFETFTEAAGYPPLVLEGKMVGTIFLLGPPVKNGTLKLPADYNVKRENVQGVRKLSDDWPYLYVQPNVVDWPYLAVLCEIILIGMYAARRFLFVRNEASSWQMFFLGSAFMLLELHAISFLSLLYGSTWVTSALVINGILIMILIANTFVDRYTERIAKAQPLVYCLLILSILVSFLLPVDTLMAAAKTNQIAIYSIVTILTILPMGVAAIVFANSFVRVPNVSKALAFNLFGAVIGGMLEYLSNYWGIKSLDLVAIGLYTISAVCYFKGSNEAIKMVP